MPCHRESLVQPKGGRGGRDERGVPGAAAAPVLSTAHESARRNTRPARVSSAGFPSRAIPQSSLRQRTRPASRSGKAAVNEGTSRAVHRRSGRRKAPGPKSFQARMNDVTPRTRPHVSGARKQARPRGWLQAPKRSKTSKTESALSSQQRGEETPDIGFASKASSRRARLTSLLVLTLSAEAGLASTFGGEAFSNETSS